MKNSIRYEKEELRKFGFSDQLLKKLSDLISLDHYKVHIRAKEALIEEGKAILPVMHKLLKSDSSLIRKEAIKVVERIAHPTSIAPVIEALEDRESDIRWIAAETLIRIGRKSIKPLLKALVKNGNSYLLRQGAHHILKKLITDEDTEELKELVKITRHNRQISEIIPVKAEAILNKEVNKDVL
jgi:HEAT repeat protein